MRSTSIHETYMQPISLLVTNLFDHEPALARARMAQNTPLSAGPIIRLTYILVGEIKKGRLSINVDGRPYMENQHGDQALMMLCHCVIDHWNIIAAALLIVTGRRTRRQR